MLHVVCRLVACLFVLSSLGCSKKLQEKGLQWRTQCEQMVLKGADGLLSHHDCYNRCVSHYADFCVGKCAQSLQEAKMNHQEATNQCKKDIRLYMGKKCRHVCEMNSTELKAYRISFAEGIATDGGLFDSACPCKNQKPDTKTTPDDAAPGIIAEDETVPLNNSIDPHAVDMNISGPTTSYDLPWMALPGTMNNAGSSADLPWLPAPAFPSYQTYGGLNNDLPWRIAPPPASAPGQFPQQGTANPTDSADDDTAARRAETEKEAAEAFSKDDADDASASNQGSAGDSFFKGFKPLAKFSVDPNDPNSGGGLLDGLKQQAGQLKGTLKKDVDQLGNSLGGGAAQNGASTGGFLDNLKQQAGQLKGTLKQDVDQLKNTAGRSAPSSDDDDDGALDSDGNPVSKNPLDKLKSLQKEVSKDVKEVGNEARNVKSGLNDVRSLFKR
jgi:hypothetical protein